MGYGSQIFATGVEFDDWADKLNAEIFFRKYEKFLTVLTVNVAQGEEVTCPIQSTVEFGYRDWGDGTINQEEKHTYRNAGIYNIRCIYSEIRSEWFKNNTSLIGVSIPEGVSRIENRAFYGCVNISKIRFNAQNCNMAYYNSAFAGVGQNNPAILIIGNCVKYLVDNAFCSEMPMYFKQIVFEEGSVCESIACSAFRGVKSDPDTSLQRPLDIEFPESVSVVETYYGGTLFDDGIGTITFKSKIPPTINHEGENYNTKKIIVPFESLEEYKSAAWFSTTTIDAIAPVSEVKGANGTLTIATSNWSSNAYTVTVEDLGENDAVFFTPVTREDKTAIEDAGVFISTEGSAVTFTCEYAPSADITFKYFICRGA